MDPFTMAMLAMTAAQMGMSAGGVGQQKGGILGGPPRFPQRQNFGGNMNKPPFMMPDPYGQRRLLGQTNNQSQYNPYQWRM